MKSPANFRLEETTLALLAQLANQLHTTRTDVIEQAVTAYATLKMKKHNRLMSLAGSYDEETADDILSDIKQSRRNKNRDFAE